MNDIMEQLCGKIGDADYQKKSVIVQGITGKFGSRHTKLMLEYGTNIVAGVTPGKGGTKFEHVPIYENMSDAVKATGARISIVFVPAKFFLGAATDALNAGIKLLVAIPEHVPIRDTLQVLEIAESKGATVIGPNTPGLIVPDVIKVGIMPASPFSAGDIVVISKSGTLLYEISNSLTQAGFGQSAPLALEATLWYKLHAGYCYMMISPSSSTIANPLFSARSSISDRSRYLCISSCL